MKKNKSEIIATTHRQTRDLAKQGKVIVIVGPNASGKSDLAIKIAKRFNGEIISADSRQVYKEMDIGTGKVTKEEQRLVKHHLIDIVSPKKEFTVDTYKRLGRKAIDDILKKGKIPIICGGTGFYIDALIFNIPIPNVPPDKKLRAKLEKQSLKQLYSRLLALDSRRAKNIDSKNKRRVIRALEIILTTKKPIPLIDTRYYAQNTIYDVLWIGINPGKNTLAKKIEKRLDQRLNPPTGKGMIAEVKKLHNPPAGKGVSWKRLESFGLEYRWVTRYLQKNISKTEMQDFLLRDIIKYSKRQMTWFKHNQAIAWIKNTKEAEKMAKRFLLK